AYAHSREGSMRIRSLRYALIFVAAATVACSSRVSEPTPGMYRAELALPGGATPIGLEVAKEQERYVLYLSNGSERSRVPNVRVENSELIAVFPGYENSLRASMRRDALDGTITLIKAGGKEQVIPFKAQLGQTHRFYADAATVNTDVAGRWEATFTSDEGQTSKAVAVLEQQRDRVTGTVMTPTGDHRFLEGQVRGDELQLSTFAGGLAYLYRLKLNPAGEFEGDYWQGLAEHVKVVARRNDAATLAGAGPQTTLKSEKFDFTFADADGKPVSLSDERFRGKVVVVTLGGSWCPNCHDEAAFLTPFYREYRDKGFEIIALMFERHGAFEKAASAVRGYRNDLGIEFTTLIAGLSETGQASEALPSLSGIYGFPTTIFVDKKGVVRDIHVGFSGPATGKYYEEHVAAFRSQVDSLLAEVL
ncbi:MAG: TlpA disulfide reductase family protein, partial [Steroidobacteraceae bacterium]